MAERIVVSITSTAVGTEAFTHVTANTYVLSKEAYEALERAIFAGATALQSSNADGTPKVPSPA